MKSNAHVLQNFAANGCNQLKIRYSLWKFFDREEFLVENACKIYLIFLEKN